MAAHKALGRGLDALFSSASSQTLERQGDVQQISVEKIKPNRHQPRIHFDPTALEELAQSIKTHGLAQPLVVTAASLPGEFELVAGERRLRASRLAGLATVPCVVRQLSHRERFELALIENLQREDLNALEEATALDGLMKEYSLTQEEVASAIGKSRSTVANSLRFLRLHEDVQAALRSGQITEGHAKCLAGVPEHSEQLRLLSKIIQESLTVRDLEAVLAEAKSQKKPRQSSTSSPSSSDVKKYEEQFQRHLGRRVDIQTDGYKGWIRFAFYSPEDLENLCKHLGLLNNADTELPS